jgi:hypothetical protein
MSESLQRIKKETFGELIMLSRLKTSSEIVTVSASTRGNMFDSYQDGLILNKNNGIEHASTKENVHQTMKIKNDSLAILSLNNSRDGNKDEFALNNHSELSVKQNSFSTSLADHFLHSTIETRLKETINDNLKNQSLVFNVSAAKASVSYSNILEQLKSKNESFFSSLPSTSSKSDLPLSHFYTFFIIYIVPLVVLSLLLLTCLCCVFCTYQKNLRKKKSNVSFYFLEESTLSKILLYISSLKIELNREFSSLNNVNFTPNSNSQESQSVQSCHTFHPAKKTVKSNKREHLTSNSNASSI